MKQDQVNAILDKVATQFGIEDLGFTTDGMCTIRIDDKFDVHMEISDDTDQLRLFGDVAELKLVEEKNMFRDFLCANLPNKEKGNNYFSINEDAGKLMLCSEIDVEKMEIEYFITRLEAFVNFNESCLDKVKSPEGFYSNGAQKAAGTSPTVDGNSKKMAVSGTDFVQSKLLNQINLPAKVPTN